MAKQKKTVAAAADAQPPIQPHTELPPAAAEAAGNADEEAFAARYPLTAALMRAYRDAHPDQPPSALRVTSSRDGFRRAGLIHPAAPVDHPIEAFRLPERIEALLAEPMLTVELA